MVHHKINVSEVRVSCSLLPPSSSPHRLARPQQGREILVGERSGETESLETEEANHAFLPLWEAPALKLVWTSKEGSFIYK